MEPFGFRPNCSYNAQPCFAPDLRSVSPSEVFVCLKLLYALYKFVRLPDYVALREPLLELMLAHERCVVPLLLAEEGHQRDDCRVPRGH